MNILRLSRARRLAGAETRRKHAFRANPKALSILKAFLWLRLPGQAAPRGRLWRIGGGTADFNQEGLGLILAQALGS